MGAGASSLPTKLTKEDILKVSMDMYFSFKDADGLVDRELLIQAAFSGQEKEVYDLYMKFTTDGLMDAGNFHKFCTTSKLLNKTSFTVGDSVTTFEKSRKSVSLQEGKSVKSINYSTFRKFLLPDVASKKEIHLDNLIFKLSRVDANTPLLLHVPELQIDGVDVVEVDDDDDEDPTDDERSPNKSISKKSMTDVSIGSPVENSAAKRIQSCSRMRIASRRVMELKHITSTANIIRESDFDKPADDNAESEIIMERYFKRMCRTGEMDLAHCVKMCRDAEIVNKQFTAVDVELCFIKAKLKAASKDCPKYNSGVIFGKRITYKVFREVLLRCISEKKAVPIETIVHHLTNAEACFVAPKVGLHSLATAIVSAYNCHG